MSALAEHLRCWTQDFLHAKQWLYQCGMTPPSIHIEKNCTTRLIKEPIQMPYDKYVHPALARTYCEVCCRNMHFYMCSKHKPGNCSQPQLPQHAPAICPCMFTNIHPCIPFICLLLQTPAYMWEELVVCHNGDCCDRIRDGSYCGKHILLWASVEAGALLDMCCKSSLLLDLSYLTHFPSPPTTICYFFCLLSTPTSWPNSLSL